MLEKIIFILCIISIILNAITLIFVLRSGGKNGAEEKIREEFKNIRGELLGELREGRKESTAAVNDGLRTNIELQNSNLRTVSQNINESLGGFRKSVNDMTAAMEQRMENLRVSMDKKLGDIQADNQKKLDEMRGVVDEKLQKTLDEKIGQSFKAVSERLEQVYKGLGEMQTLANDVGDLQKTLINVKTRGNLGELQLSRILDQIMAPSLYSENVITKRGSSDRVEFAVKLPGKSESDGPVYLPIDSKFPTSAYNALQDAYDSADQESIEQASKSLEAIIKKCAKDISDKYIDPPNTTEFAIMFLPIEGLYAEVVRRSELMEELQRKYRINVAGPTTITALLNSLQMGFKTLAIEKRSGEVWKLLSAVKKEFGNFAEVLNNAKEKINRANEEMDKLVGVRTRQIIRSLKNVEEMPELESAQQMIDSTGDAAGDVETE